MSENPAEPEPTPDDGAAPGGPAFLEQTERDEVTVRRAPRHGRFLALGAAVGAVAALVLTFAFPENEQFDRGQVFGFLLLACAAFGVALGGLVALLLDRSASRAARTALVEHEQRRQAE